MERSFFDWVGYILQKYGGELLSGAGTTMLIAVIGTVAGFLIGLIIGSVRTIPVSPSDSGLKKGVLKVVNFILSAYVEIFRGTPMMVQAMVIYYGLRQNGVNISSFVAAVLVILLNTGAYMAESVRGGISAIDNGQFEGAKAMGMSHFTTMFSVVLPQVFRNLIPEMGNQFITNLKMTSVLNVIGIAELYFVTKTAANTYYRYFEAFLITGIIYLVLCEISGRLLSVLEKKMQGKKDYELAPEYFED